MNSKLLFLLLFFCSLTHFAQTVTHKPVPDWVEVIEPDFKKPFDNPDNEGFHYLLINEQHHMGVGAYYTNYVYQVLNSQGVQDMSSISMEFDPSYSEIGVHHVHVYRNGELINKFDPRSFQMIKREPDMERNLYNGRVTAVSNLSDIRVGDIIDYAYTQYGSNPIHEGKYAGNFPLQYTLPVNLNSFSVVVPEGQTFDLKEWNEPPSAQVTTTNEGKRYTWQSQNTKAIFYEDNTPYWYWQEPRVMLSQFKNWKEVAGHYGKHFKVSSKDKLALQQAVSHIEELDGGISGIVQFVQDEIRYLGFENGLNGYKPSNPAEVLERRFGDCKDKSFLLSELLKLKGYEAAPMLVHSSLGRTLKDQPASLYAFDHCVVYLKDDKGNISYIDPTISNQGQDENGEVYFPDYKYGLILQPGASSLTALPHYDAGKTTIFETFSLDDAIGAGAVLEVETTYEGADADLQRGYFSSSNLAELKKSYESFYGNMYTDIKMVGEIALTDNRNEGNVLVVREKYRIDSLWVRDTENDKMIYSEFYPTSLDNYVYPTQTPNRTMPYYQSGGIDIEHNIKVYVPQAWPIDNETFAVTNDAFTYTYDRKYKNATLDIKHTYKTMGSVIPAANLSKYVQDHSKLQDNLSYMLTYDTSFLTGNDTAGSTSFLSWFLLLTGFVLSAFVAVKIYHNYDLPSKNTEEPLKIGGWLILFAIGLTLAPIASAIDLFATPEFFTPALWSQLAATSDTLLLVVVFELILNPAFIVFYVLAAVLFYQRRTIAPRIIIVLIGSKAAYLLIDNLLAAVAGDIPIIDDDYKDIGRAILYAAIWIPYFIVSKRVAQTFTVTKKSQSPQVSNYDSVTEVPLALENKNL